MPSLVYPLTLVSLLGLVAGFLFVTAMLPESSSEGIEISQAEYGDQWPFAIQQGRLRCEGTGAVIFTARVRISGSTVWLVGATPPLSPFGKVIASTSGPSSRAG